MANVAINLKHAEHVESKNSNMFWDGWTLVIVNESKDGYQDRKGIYFNGKWSVCTRVNPNERGRYFVPKRYVKSA